MLHDVFMTNNLALTIGQTVRLSSLQAKLNPSDAITVQFQTSSAYLTDVIRSKMDSMLDVIQQPLVSADATPPLGTGDVIISDDFKVSCWPLMVH